MKKNDFGKLLGAAGMCVLLMFSSGARADLIDIEPVNQKVGGFLGYPSFSWTHTLENFTLGSAVSGELRIEMSDDEYDFCGYFGCAGEVTSVIVGIIDFQDGAIIFNPNNGLFQSDLGTNSINGLNSTGMLNVTLLPTGDFWVGRSFLEIRTATTRVPEPATLGLLGLGLVGIGLSRRRQMRAPRT